MNVLLALVTTARTWAAPAANPTAAKLLAGGLVAWALGPSTLGGPGQPQQALPYSTLPMKLLGVAMDETPSRSACLIRCLYPEERQSTRLFAPGERACDVAEIKEVLRESVVIENLLTNRLELLAFEKSAAPTAPAPAEVEPAPPAPRAVATAPTAITVEVRKEVVDHYLANLPDILSSALATPRYRDSGTGQPTIEGFEISQIKEASFVEQLGLRNGDVILEVNGETLDGMASAIRLLGQVRATAQTRLTVLRAGQKLTFVISVK